jgi:hypothetical protein
MKIGLHHRAKCWLILIAALGSLGRSFGQLRMAPPQEPRLLTLNLQQANVGIYSEGSYEQTTFQQSNISATESHLFVGPEVGLTLDGSVYHPNLIRFNFNGWLAAGLGQIKVQSGSSSYTQNQLQYLGAFGGGMNLLANKPLNATIFGGYGRTYLDYDSFNRVWVEGWRYGSRFNYNNGPWLFTGGYTYADNTTTAISGDYASTQNIVDFTGTDTRDRGGTRLNYTYNQNSYNDAYSNLTGSDQTVTLGDNEQFGTINQFQLNSGASYTVSDYTGPQSRQLDADATLNGQHPNNFTSSLNFTYDNFSQGSYNSASYGGQAQVAHQLFQSLTSSLTLRGAEIDSTDANFNGYLRTFGIGLGESYTKSLTRISTLFINNTLFVEHNDQKTTGTIKNEQHTFATDNTFSLNLPNIIQSSVVLYQNNGQPPYRQGIDYTVTGGTARTIITRLDGGRIPSGATVLVNYNVVPTTAGSYDTLSETLQVRVEFWQRLLAAYARMNLYYNNAPASMRLQNVTDYIFGTELNWRWLGTGAAYELYNSDGYSYSAARLFQSASFSPDGASSMSLNASEAWISYSQTSRQEQDYLVFGRYHRALTYRLGLDVDAGVAYRSGAGVDQTLGVARAALNYVIGKTSVNLSYDYGFESFLSAQQLQRHLFWLTLKRNF